MREDIKKYKEFYYRIGFIICPVLNNDKVHFNNHGFNHLLRKQGIPRSYVERKRRFELIKYIKTVIEKGKIVEYRKSHSLGVKTRFWSLSYKIENKTITVVIRKLNFGHLHFYSVFDER